MLAYGVFLRPYIKPIRMPGFTIMHINHVEAGRVRALQTLIQQLQAVQRQSSSLRHASITSAVTSTSGGSSTCETFCIARCRSLS